jgi:hypothetical protein
LKGQASFEAIVNVGILVVVLAVIVWSVDSKKESLSSSIKKNFFDSACNKLRNALLISWEAPNTTTSTFFDASFNLSFDDSSSFFISRNDDEALCSVFTKEFVNSTGESAFNFFVEYNITLHNNGTKVVVS